MIRLFVAAILIVLFSYIFSQFRRAPPAQKKKWMVYLGIYALIAISLLLVATGRAHWITAVIAAAVGLIHRFLPLLIRLWPVLGKSWFARRRASQANHSPNISSVETDFLNVELDHDSGTMSGNIKSGLYAGQALADLTPVQLQTLLSDYAQRDRESFQLLQAYAQRQYGEEFADAERDAEQSQANSHSGNGEMGEAEALAILGLQANPSAEDINKAYKKLMSKLHPDHGGSNYLAAKVNQAKQRLMSAL